MYTLNVEVILNVRGVWYIVFHHPPLCVLLCIVFPRRFLSVSKQLCEGQQNPHRVCVGHLCWVHIRGPWRQPWECKL